MAAIPSTAAVPKRRRRQSAAPVELAQLPGHEYDRDDGRPMAAPVSVADVRAERELDDILSDIGGGDIKIKVSRKSETGRMQTCGELPGDTFSMETLTDAFGGGEYLLRFCRGRDEVARTSVEVDPLIPARNPRMPRTLPGAAAPPAQNIGDMAAVMGSVVTMMATMMTAQMQSTQALVAGMSEMMKARPETRDPLETLKTAAEILRPAQPTLTPAAELIGMLEKGMSMGRKMNGDDGEGGSVLPIVAEGVRGLTAVLTSAADERRANAHATMAAARAPAPAPDATAVVSRERPVVVVEPTIPPSALTADAPMDYSMFRPWIAAAMPHKGVLALMAGKAQPENAAALILDVLTNDQLADLIDDITADGAMRPMGETMEEGLRDAPSIGAFAERTRMAFGLAGAMDGWLRDVAVSVLQVTEDDGGDLTSIEEAP